MKITITKSRKILRHWSLRLYMSGHVFPYLLLIDKITANRMSAVTSLFTEVGCHQLLDLNVWNGRWPSRITQDLRYVVQEVAKVRQLYSRLAASECRRLHGSSFPESSGLPLGFALKRCVIKHRWWEKTQTRNSVRKKKCFVNLWLKFSLLCRSSIGHYTDSLKYMHWIKLTI